MSKQSDAVKRWRKNMKMKIVQSMGGCCQICRYDKCQEAMDLHHLDPKMKELTFGDVMANPRSWKTKIVPELEKCILLCNRCHREYHAGVIEIPETYQIFDESLITRETYDVLYNKCPVCYKQKPSSNKYCSYRCSSTVTSKKFVDSDELKRMVDDGNMTGVIAKHFNVSPNTIRRKKKDLNIKTDKIKIVWPTPDILEKELWKKPTTTIASELGVSDKAVEKHVNKLGLSKPPRGFWQTKEGQAILESNQAR